MWTALGFLTIFPTPRKAGLRALSSGAAWYPFVGLIIGLVAGAAYLTFNIFFNGTIAAALTLLIWVLLTGGLHLDGLADSCDGLFAALSQERRLEIMRDPRPGAFGVIGLVLVLLTKFAIISALSTQPVFASLFPFLLATTVARWLILPVARMRRARTSGLGSDFAAGIKVRTLLLAALLPVGLVALGDLRAIAALLLALFIVSVIVRAAYVRLGGISGDVLGALVELSEVAILLAFAFQWPYG